jgi:peptidylamidoglycolate lyase
VDVKHQPWLAVAVFVAALITVSLDAQTKGSSEKGGIDLTGPYDVVENWFKPLHEGRQQCVLGVFAESPNRIYLVTEVEVPATRPVGNCTSERSVAGSHSHFILVLNGQGQVIEDWSQWNTLFPWDASGHGMPHSIKINPYDAEKHVWIVNRDAHLIHSFTHDGKQLVMTLGEKNVSGNDDKHFNLPADIEFLPDGSFLVADGYGNSRVVKFDRNGKYLTAWGTNGSGPGQFKVPHGVAVDSDRRVYVADRDNQRVQVFDANGKYLDEWPNIRGIVFLMATRDRALWVLTGSTNRLLKYDLSGHLQTYWGTANTQGVFPGSLYAPHSFSVDSDGALYIADYRNHRVQKFVPRAAADRTRLVGQPVK